MNGAAMVVATLLINTLLSAGLGFLQNDNGEITFGASIRCDTRICTPVDIANSRSDTLDDVLLAVPVAAPIESILASRPIRLSLVQGAQEANGTRLVSVSALEAGTKTRLLIPLAAGDTASVSVVNAGARGLKIMTDSSVPPRAVTIMKNAFSGSIPVALVYGVFLYFVRQKQNELHEEVIASRKEADNLTASVKEAQADLKYKVSMATNSQKRLEILQMARMSDYARELEFWRNTVRHFLRDAGKTAGAAEALIAGVTTGLKTFGTRKEATQFETIQTLALMMQRGEEGKR